MANQQVKSSATGTMGNKAAKRSRYEKLEVAYGQVQINGATPDVVFGDTAIFGQIPAKELIHAHFVSNAGTPDVLDLYCETDSVNTPTEWTLAKDATKIDYVVSYKKGTGHPGAGNANSGSTGLSLALTLLPSAPAVTYPAAAVPADVTCLLKASVQPNGAATTVVFEYGTTTAYGETVETSAVVADGVIIVTAVTGTATDLTAETTYHFRAVATNAGGTTNGADQTFTTTA